MKKTRFQNAVDNVEQALNTQKLAHFFELFYNHHRGTGSTDMAIESCIHHKAFLLVSSEAEASEMEARNEGLLAAAPETHMPPVRKHIVDTKVVYHLAQQYRILEAHCRELLEIIEMKKLKDKA